MSSSNSAEGKPPAADSTASYLFPDISSMASEGPSDGAPGDDFHITHLKVDGGGFYSLVRHRESRFEDPEEILNKAKIKAKAIEQEAYDEGLAKGAAAARTLVEKDFESLFATLNQALSEVERFKKSLEKQAEKDAVTLAFAIARKVVYHEISTREETIFELIHEALKQVPDQKSATVRVSPPDYERIKERVLTFAGDAAHLENMRMEPDGSVQEGDCIIDTPFGMIDARVDKRLQAVEAALKSMLK